MCNDQTMYSTETRKSVLSLVILIGFSNTHNCQQFIIKNLHIQLILDQKSFKI